MTQKMPRFTIILPAGMHDAIRQFLFNDPSREYMGVILAGVSESESEVKLLGRSFIPVRGDEYDYQAYAGLTVRRQFSQKLMQTCAREGLSQIDVHSHPFGASPNLWFSGTDDQHERIMARYIYERLPSSLYASLVMNQGYTKARMWLPEGNDVTDYEVQTLTLAEHPFRKISIASDDESKPKGKRRGFMGSSGASKAHEPAVAGPADLFSRQILAFGAEGQTRIAKTSVTVIGAGGLGSILVEGLTRLGFLEIIVIDPDIAEVSNLNRVAGMTHADAVAGVKKVDIACRTVEAINPKARASAISTSVFDSVVLDVLKSSDLIVVATDNHATRMYAQRVGIQYLIPVISVGVNIDVDETGKIEDISGEYAIALPGEAGWCLSCAHAYNPEIAAWEMADAVEQQRWVHRGYVSGADVKAPSVAHLNGIIANLALAEIHNLLAPYKKFVGYLAYDQVRSELMPYTIERNKECALCSAEALLGMGDIEPMPNYLALQQREQKVPPPPEPTWDEEEQPAELMDREATSNGEAETLSAESGRATVTDEAVERRPVLPVADKDEGSGIK